jgi:NAD(P)-dependent dehydrogenase (short-subunit alcohol dehydrogenase family)
MTAGADGADGGAVVVTGAARGIGAAIARRFAEDGYAVVGVDLDGDQLHEVMAGLPGAEAVVGDVTDEKLMAEACERGAARGLRAFVANAGVAQPGPSVDYPIEAWDQLLAIHLTAAFTGARQAFQRMPGGGAIVMISSVNGHLGFGGRAAYCAAKAGVQGLVRSLAVEWAPRGVRVNAVSPGTIATEMQAKFMATGYASPELFLSRVPMKRFGEPREIADAVHFLCSPRSSYITGVVLPVDGGWLADGLPAAAD